MIKNIYLNGTKLSLLNESDLLNEIYEAICNQRKLKILSGNIYSFNLASKLTWFNEEMNKADIVRNDSAGLQLAGKLLNINIPERNTWADFGWSLAKFCEKEKFTLFFLGDKQGVAQKAKNKLLEKYPKLKVVGTNHGYFNKQGEENDKVISIINNIKPDILIVGFGMPLQENWIKDNHENLNANIIITGGNCFSFLAGEESRAPEWMHKNGLEWLYRFLKEPGRMFNRYIIGNPLFFFRVLKQKFGFL